MMTGCGSLKRGTHTEKTMVLGTDMFGTWLHSCLSNVRQKKKKISISYTVATQGQLFLLENKKEF